MNDRIQKQLVISDELRNRGIKGLPDHWQNYILCIILHMFLPLLPITMEYWLNGIISDKTLTLAASMYTITIGISSRNPLFFGSTIVASIVFAFSYGIVVDHQSTLPYIRIISFIGIVTVFIAHLLERYNRHIIDRSPFLPFFDIKVKGD